MMTKREYVEKKCCFKCGKPLIADRGFAPDLNRRYHIDCAFRKDKIKADNKTAIKRGATHVKCPICEKDFPLNKVNRVNYICPACEKHLDDCMESHKKVMKELNGTSSESESKIELPPYLKGKTAKERQDIAYRTFMQRERELESFRSHSAPKPPQDPHTEPYWRGCFAPVKKKEVPKDTAPTEIRTVRNQETGALMQVECRGTGFYGARSPFARRSR